MTFTADVKGVIFTARLKYSWTISVGTISAGQNTSSIVVDTESMRGDTITATVEVEGLPANCPVKASCSTTVTGGPGCIRPLDSYGALDFADAAARLDNFAIRLQEEPTANGYIFVYEGRNGRAGQAFERATRAKNYLVKKREVAQDRIIIVEGGFREDMTFELWIVPLGAEPPTASPTLRPEDAQSHNP